MPITITMPALSPTMTEGKLATWLVKEGDTVSSGDVLAEIETDKATMEVEAVDEGTVGKILIEAGTDNVQVNDPIAYLLEEGEDESALDNMSAAPAASAPAEEKPVAKEEPSAQTPAAADSSAPAAPKSGDGGRIFSSPLARRIAADAGVNIADIKGTGPHGRIIRADVDEFIAGGGKFASAQPAKSEAAVQAAPAAMPAGPTPPHEGEREEIPLTGMRKTIAKRLTEAKQTIPHFYLTIECELDNLLAMRKELNSRSDDYKISVNDFIIRASALALKKLPAANAIWGGDKILRYKDIDISVAVAIDGGLITPVVKNADKRGLADISEDIESPRRKSAGWQIDARRISGRMFLDL